MLQFTSKIHMHERYTREAKTEYTPDLCNVINS